MELLQKQFSYHYQMAFREAVDYRSRLINFVREVHPSCTDDDTTAYHKGLAIHWMFDPTSQPLSYDLLTHSKETLHQMLKRKIDSSMKTLTEMMKAEKIIASGGDWSGFKTVVFMVDITAMFEVTNREEDDYRSRLINFVREVHPSCTDDDTTAYHKGLAIHWMFDPTSQPLSYDLLKHPKETLHQMLKEKIDHFQFTLFRMMKADKIIASGGDWRAVKDWTIPVNNVKSMVDI